jgi:hypothetical protein
MNVDDAVDIGSDNEYVFRAFNREWILQDKRWYEIRNNKARLRSLATSREVAMAEEIQRLRKQLEAVKDGYTEYVNSVQTAEQAEIERLMAENKTLSRIPKGEVWYWQGDGEDYPESLGCPVIMEPDVLRGLLEKARGHE